MCTNGDHYEDVSSNYLTKTPTKSRWRVFIIMLMLANINVILLSVLVWLTFNVVIEHRERALLLSEVHGPVVGSSNPTYKIRSLGPPMWITITNHKECQELQCEIYKRSKWRFFILFKQSNQLSSMCWLENLGYQRGGGGGEGVLGFRLMPKTKSPLTLTLIHMWFEESTPHA